MRTPFGLMVLVLGCLFIVPSTLADQPPRPGLPSYPPRVRDEPPPDFARIAPEGLTGEWLSTSRPIGRYEDITAATRIQITGGVTFWATPLDDRIVEHVAGRTPAGELYVFWRDAAGVQQTVNVSAKTGGVRIATDPVAWLGVRPYEHIAAITASGALHVFSWSPATDWTSSNISLTSGRNFAGNLVTWKTPGSPATDNLAATSTTGEVWVFSRNSPFVPFSRVNVTATTGVTASGVGGGWNSPASVDHVAVTGTDKKLHELTRRGSTWSTTVIPLPHDVTTDVGTGQTLLTEAIAVRSTLDTLFFLTRGFGGTTWTIQDLTQFDGERVAGRPAIYWVPNTFVVTVRRADNELLAFWNAPGNPVWQVLSLTDLTGMTATSTPAVWVESVWAAGHDNHLRLYRDFIEARLITMRLMAPFASLSWRFGSRKSVTILWNPETNDTNCAAATGSGCAPCNRAEIGNGVRLKFRKSAAEAAMQKVSAYLNENSGGLLTLDNVATLGWFTSKKPGAHYWQTHSPETCADGWWARNPSEVAGGDVEKWAEAIRLADPFFNFAAFDTNGDKTLQEHELVVVIMIPQPIGAVGHVRPVVAENHNPLRVDGVVIPLITEVYVLSPEKPGSDITDGVPHIGLTAHELSHHLLDHTDMYWTDMPPTALGAHGLMDILGPGAHHDAWSKLKLGWVRPRIIWHPGRYTLPDVETRRTVRALLHPTRGTGEYLLFENRHRGTSFDKGLPADGLAIYHVMEDPAIHQRSQPPFYWTNAQWATIGASDWGHRAVRMIRPVSTSGTVFDGGSSEDYHSFFSVWRSDHSRTGYDLEPFPAARERAWLRWGDGANPGLAVRDFSSSGPEMKFTISTVSLANLTLCAAAGKNCDWIPDGFGGAAYCGQCMSPNWCGGGRVPNVCGCIPKTCESGYCGQLSDGCGGFIECDTCEPGTFCNRFNRCETPPEPCECGGKPPNCIPCPIEPVAKPPL